MKNIQPLTRNIAKSGEVLDWGSFSPFQLHFGLIVNRSQSASCHIVTVRAHAKKDNKPLTISETEKRNMWSSWTYKRTEPCFYHSTENDKNSISPASHFLKFLCQPAFGTFAKPHKPTHNPSFAKEPNLQRTNNNNFDYLSYILRYNCTLAPNNLTDMNRIKEVLEEKGIKQTWLAEKLGKSYNMVNSYVQNRQQPRLEVLMEIAEILDIDVKELIISNKESKK